MPRHPPNALLTLDRSHCQCSSLFGFGKPFLLAHRSEGCQTWPYGHLSVCRTASPKARLPFTTGPVRCHRRVRHGPHWNYAEQFRGRVLRPASRDESGDARSGNINPAKPSDEGEPSNNDPCLWTTNSSFVPDTSSLHNVSRTGINSQRSDANFISPRISASSTPNKMVELSGIEPLTPCLQSRCSPS
jgi:hypothetical protein